jgi:hypothetical protein
LPSAPSPLGPRIKIQRAKKHIYELDSEIQGFLKRNPYLIFSEIDPDNGNKVWHVRVRKDPPPRWSAIAGDAIHNLRSSLDLLVGQLVLANGGTIADKTAFPIWDSESKYKSSRPGYAKGVSKAALDILYALKPYKGGNDALWRLHRLDIVDKHRLLVAVGAAHGSVIIPIAGPDWMDGQFKDLTVGIVPADRKFPLKDGDEVFGAPADYQGDPEITVEIALNEPGVVEGEAVVPALHELADLIKGIVAAFDPLLK